MASSINRRRLGGRRVVFHFWGIENECSSPSTLNFLRLSDRVVRNDTPCRFYIRGRVKEAFFGHSRFRRRKSLASMTDEQHSRRPCSRTVLRHYTHGVAPAGPQSEQKLGTTTRCSLQKKMLTIYLRFCLFACLGPPHFIFAKFLENRPRVGPYGPGFILKRLCLATKIDSESSGNKQRQQPLCSKYVLERAGRRPG